MKERKLAPHSPQPGRRVGIRDIARSLQISIGSVDRALHNRSGISPVTRQRVLKTAAKLRYRPNLAARHLASRKSLTIGVCIPREISYFYDDVRDGSLDAAKSLEAFGVAILYSPYERIGYGEGDAIASVLKQNIRGLVISPGDPQALRPLIHEATRRGIPVICVATDAPESERLTCVSVDPFSNGSIAGELMGQFLSDRRKIVVFTGMMATEDHFRKVEGFRQSFSVFPAKKKEIHVIETHDDETEAYEKSSKIFEEHRDVSGVYIATANSIPVLQAMEDLGAAGKVKVICTDLFTRLVPWIESGRVAATIYQRPRDQGRIAIETIFRFLAERVSPPPRINLAPSIVVKSNVRLFLSGSRP